MPAHIRYVAAVSAAGFAIFGFSHVARAADAPLYCAPSDIAALADRPNVAWSSCVVANDRILVESGYYQNASSVGSSEIAEYPNVKIVAGLGRGVELVFDAPTEIDRSLNNGRGDYGFSDTGVGFKYQLSSTSDGALSLGGEIHPPSTPASYHAQPKYHIEAEQSRRLGQLSGTLGLALVDDRRVIRNEESAPALRPSAGVAYSPTATTTVALEILDQASIAHSMHAQSFDGISLRRVLSRHLLFDVEGGQTINASANSRPHYIGAGLTFAK